MRLPIFAAAAALALGAAAPALAQSTVEALTVIGRYAPRGEPPAQLSRVVDYSDLDLRYAAGQDELRHRVRLAARDICAQLGREQPNAANLGRSCEDLAMRDAMAQVGQAVTYAMAHPPLYAVAAPPPPPPAAEGYGEPASAQVPDASAAPNAGGYGQTASYTTETITNGPVPDTPANRARYGQPMSRAGQNTAAAGN